MADIPKPEDNASLEISMKSGDSDPVTPENKELGVVLDAFPEAIYVTDKYGLITFYNQAAANLWGYNPPLGKRRFCGCWKLFRADGTLLRPDECSMAVALKEQRPIRGVEAIATRPDNSQVLFLAFPTPIFDVMGSLIGGVNILVDISHLNVSYDIATPVEVVVDSEDAIITKDLNGTIVKWNSGAQRLFGYSPQEVIGQSIFILAPMDRQDEQPEILQRIRRNECIEHFETIRQRKDGTLVEISLSISPIKNRKGRIVGAAKIARDITGRRQSKEQKNLLAREMAHRVEDLLILAKSVISLSAQSASTQLPALAGSNSRYRPQGFTEARPTTLHRLIQIAVAPYANSDNIRPSRVSVAGPDIATKGNVAMNIALLLHELSTNSAIYGSLSLPGGSLEIRCEEIEDQFAIVWSERNGPLVGQAPKNVGFGTRLANATVISQLGGTISRDWKPEGLEIKLTFSASLFQAL